MRFKSLQTRLTFIFGMCFLLTLLALGVYGLISSWRSQASFLESSSASTTAAVEQLMEEKAQVVSLSIKAELEIALDSARTIADSLAGMRAAREVPESGRALINSMLRNVLMRNEHFVGVYTDWEPGALDGKDAQYAGKPGHDETGRFIPYWSRGEGGKIGIEPLTDYENHDQYENGVRKGEYYLLPRERKSECVIDPYPYVIQGKTVWITSLVAPIIVDGIFRGIGGVDLRLDFIQSLADGASQDLFGGAGSVTIVTGDGIIAASSGKPVSVGSRLRGWDRIQASIGQRTDSQSLLEDGAPEVAATVPLQIGRAESAWAVLIRIPKDAALAQVQEMVAGMERQGKIQLIKQTVVGLLVSMLALIIIWYASLSIAKPLRRLSSVAATIADGDLRAASSELQCKAEAAGSSGPRPEEQDEPGQLACAFRRMVASLGSLIGEVQHSGIQVTSSATEIAASARQLESTVSEQAAGTAQVMTAAREILSTTRGLAQTIESISAVAEDTASLAGKSQARLATTEAGMERLVEATAAISAGLSAIRDKADGIGGIITTITKVADQTNLLSLNAAIEAEKAGEYGVGFSVVAREIRRLADQTAAATLDIEDMIKAMRKAVTSGVVDTDKFIERVREGGTEVREVGAQMTAIIEQVRALTPRLSEVSRAMQVQCTEAEQINESITQISSAAQQTRDSAEEFNKVAQQLSAASRAMSKEVMAFKVDS